MWILFISDENYYQDPINILEDSIMNNIKVVTLIYI